MKHSTNRSVIARLVRKPIGVGAVVVVLIVVLACALADVIAPYDPIASDFDNMLSGPTPEHLLGTDSLGRDILSRILYGGQITLVSIGVAAITSVFLGILLGLLAGYLGGIAESIIMRVVDALQALPNMIVLLMVLAIFPGNMTITMAVLGVLMCTAVVRVVRSAALAVRRELYVDSARVGGLSNGHIIMRHILPRVLGPVIVQASLVVGVCVMVTSSLGFLGLGVAPPSPSWGSMVAESAPLIQIAPWQVVPVGVLITILVLALGLFGDVLRDTVAERWSSKPAIRRRKRTGARTEMPSEPSALTNAASEPEDSRGALLSVRDLRIAFGDSDNQLEVVHGVSFDMSSGSTLGIVGESGSGKTVTVRSIIGQLRGSGAITGGSIRFDGNELTDLDAAAYAKIRGSQIGFVPQEPIASLDPCFKIGDQLAEVVRLHTGGTRKSAQERAVELLGLVKIKEPERVAGLFPHQISGGMAQRVSIARALSGEPRLLIADEPTSALDVTVQKEILDLLRALQRELDLSVIMISHDLHVVSQICERVLVMHLGETKEMGSVDEVLESPKHPYTQALILADPRRATPGEPLPTISSSAIARGGSVEGEHMTDLERERATGVVPTGQAEEDRARMGSKLDTRVIGRIKQ